MSTRTINKHNFIIFNMFCYNMSSFVYIATFCFHYFLQIKNDFIKITIHLSYVHSPLYLLPLFIVLTTSQLAFCVSNNIKSAGAPIVSPSLTDKFIKLAGYIEALLIASEIFIIPSMTLFWIPCNKFCAEPANKFGEFFR